MSLRLLWTDLEWRGCFDNSVQPAYWFPHELQLRILSWQVHTVLVIHYRGMGENLNGYCDIREMKRKPEGVSIGMFKSEMLKNANEPLLNMNYQMLITDDFFNFGLLPNTMFESNTPTFQTDIITTKVGLYTIVTIGKRLSVLWANRHIFPPNQNFVDFWYFISASVGTYRTSFYKFF